MEWSTHTPLLLVVKCQEKELAVTRTQGVGVTANTSSISWHILFTLHFLHVYKECVKKKNQVKNKRV